MAKAKKIPLFLRHPRVRKQHSLINKNSVMQTTNVSENSQALQTEVISPGNSVSRGFLSNSLVDPSDISNLPNLEVAEELPVEISTEYWDPETIGEKRRGIFVGFITRSARDFENPNITTELECAAFICPEGKEVKRFCNGSKRLVSVFKNGDFLNLAVQIEFKGEEKNKTNQYKSQIWSIKPLIVKKA